jgi:two-component system LytT family response regulator
MGATHLRVYLVDDEPLALKRLVRLLQRTGRVEIAGSATSPDRALRYLSNNPVDAVFLDIQMPEMTGFELLSKLSADLAVVFTTAYDQYALDAFQVNSIDYLLKPIDAQQLDRALAKLERLRGTPQAVLESEQLRVLAAELARGLRESNPRFPERIASRLGERIVFVNVDEVTHFYAKDKLSFAATESKDYVIDSSIAELEQKLDPAQFLRIHRSSLVNLRYVKELHSWFGSGLVIRLRDGKQTELQVARDRVPELRKKLNL